MTPLHSLQSTLHHILGPPTSHLPSAVTLSANPSTFSPNVLGLTLTAVTSLQNLSTRRLDNPRIYISFQPERSPIAADHHFLAFQTSEFALPIRAPDISLNFDFFDRPNFTRPHAVFPLLVMNKSTHTCLMLAPVDAFHDQVLAIVENPLSAQREFRWGWSGDLDAVPEAFSTTLAVIIGSSPRHLFSVWGSLIRAAASGRLDRPLNLCGRYDDVAVAKLSMWTDNGSSYWYRTEQGMDLPSTLEATVAYLDKHEVPIASIEFDSWFYPHEITRPVTELQYPTVVPPTGMLRWEPRHDVLGEGSIKNLRKRLGNRPLILHSRHISSRSDYTADPFLETEEWWIDSDRAHPAGSALFRRWMQQAADWGATVYEQDWIVEVWLGVRQLRERPGRIETWQNQLNSAAKEHNINLIWCMATMADMANAVSLSQVVAVRSCDDYRYARDPSILWRWHLTVSALIRSLGLLPFKDVFMSHSNDSNLPDINGDPNAMLEACLSALSAGPVGIGDRLGRTNIDLVRKTCRSDGTLIKPDLPLAALDRSIRDPTGLLWAETNCGPWRYVMAIRTGIKIDGVPRDSENLTETLQLDPSTPALVYNWKTKTAELARSVTASLRLHEWTLWVACPTIDAATAMCPFTLIGDTNTFATMGDRRVRIYPDLVSADKILFDVLGVQDEDVEISFWSSTGGLESRTVTIPSKGWLHCSLQPGPSNKMSFKSESPT